MGLSAISGVIAYQPSLLSYRIGNGPTLSQVGIGCLSMPILAIPSKGGGEGGGGYNSSPQSQGGQYPGCKGTVLSIKLGGIMEVAMLGFI